MKKVVVEADPITEEEAKLQEAIGREEARQIAMETVGANHQQPLFSQKKGK